MASVDQSRGRPTLDGGSVDRVDRRRQADEHALPHRLLEPLRAALWEPQAIWALLHAPTLTDERLAEACHALAA